MKPSTFQSLNLLFLSLFIFAIGYTSGRISSALVQRAEQELEITEIPDVNQLQPVVTLRALTDNQLIGAVNIPTTRVVINDDIAEIADDGTFRLNVKPILNLKFVEVPEEMHFVGSKTGTKVYPVTSSGASKIKPENRVYFHSLAEAVGEGYVE